jgi:putative transposase
MSRLPRYFVPGIPLHLIQRGNNRAHVFLSRQDFNCYRRNLGDVATAYGLEIHAYVLMTNHVHLLVTPETVTSVPKTMQAVGQRYARHFNFVYGRTGTVWEGRYKAAVIDSDEYLLTCMRYIEQNPVRAGIVAAADGYAWSSYGANALGARDKLVTTHSLYAALASTAETRQARYREFFRLQLAEVDLHAIRDATNNGWALGDARFRERIEAVSRRRAARLPLGRPMEKER